ncbi:hypothetical protein [Paracoccus onubensis]|uniref:Uncharacterized protein n=1 Tax=Paracoccus onubensis TaxID=1675788 RepID=A0A418T1T0_9RHOB|nr:hypothetical protein [Paracoccus onubensis]RJE87136.1 hypothetical protein D3P04_05140 [Paracoccus onubensis]
MFTYTDRYEFDWPVQVKLPADDGEEIQEFTGRFVMPEDELEIFGTDTGGMTSNELIKHIRVRLAKYWIGWTGIKVQGGGDLPFSAENRDNLLRQRAVRIAVDRALTEAVLGIREKN